MSKSLFTAEYRALIAVLVEARRKAAVSQRELAQRLGWSPSMVAKAEIAERRLDIAEYLRVADCLGVDPLQLIRKSRQVPRAPMRKGARARRLR